MMSGAVFVLDNESGKNTIESNLNQPNLKLFGFLFANSYLHIYI